MHLHLGIGVAHVDGHSWEFKRCLQTLVLLDDAVDGVERAIEDEGDKLGVEDGVLKQSGIPVVVIFVLANVNNLAALCKDLVQMLLSILCNAPSCQLSHFFLDKLFEVSQHELNDCGEVAGAVEGDVVLFHTDFHLREVDLEDTVLAGEH